MTGNLRSTGVLMLASAIWGFAFAAQRAGMEYVEPFVFNGIRFALGAMVLLPVLVLRKQAKRRQPFPVKKGVLLGAVLFLGASFQQAGLVHTTAGNAGFVTGMYMVLVPVFGLFVGRRTGAITWAGVAMAFGGLYLLSVRELYVSPGDALVLAGAVFWAIHVLMVDRMVKEHDPVRLALFQFAICSLLSLGASLVLEKPVNGDYSGAFWPIMYGGFLSVGIAYTLQLVGQKGTRPAHAAIVLSMEAVFALVGGWLVLGETGTARGLAGCALMLAGMLISQLSQIRNAK